MAQHWRNRLAVCKKGHVGIINDRKVIKTMNGSIAVVRYSGVHLLGPMRAWQSEDPRFISSTGSDTIKWLAAGVFNEEDPYDL